jgi:hypothetical protein
MDMSNSLLQWVLGGVFFFFFSIGFVLQPELPLVVPLPTSLTSPQPAGVQEDPVCYTLRRLGRNIPSPVSAVMT